MLDQKEFSDICKDYTYDETDYLDSSDDGTWDAYIGSDNEVIEIFYLPNSSDQTTDKQSESENNIHTFLNHTTFLSFVLSANPAKPELIEPTTHQQDQQITCYKSQINQGFNSFKEFPNLFLLEKRNVLPLLRELM